MDYNIKDISLAAWGHKEIAIAETEQAVFGKTISEVIYQSNTNAEQVQQFISLTLGNGRAIREAINSGEVRFASILELLDNADRFRSWIADQPADSNLLSAFYDEITKQLLIQTFEKCNNREQISQ
jgi:adenosylhomocysteinase